MTVNREERANRWLSEQLEQLKALRNAKVRDPDFKQWRQATLTIVQRIWPGDAKRSARFRRVPFTPPSTQASSREAREWYERGCAEAAKLLNNFVDEIAEAGLPEEGQEVRAADPEPGTAEDGVPTLDLPREGESAEPEVVEKPKPKPKAKETSRSEESSSDSASDSKPQPAKKTVRKRLRDMLGLGELDSDAESKSTSSSKGKPDEEESDDELAVDDEPADGPADSLMADLQPLGEEVTPETSQDDDDPDDSDDAVRIEKSEAPPEIIDIADDLTDEPEEDAAEADVELADEDSDLDADDFFSASPVFSSTGRPLRRLAKKESEKGEARADAAAEPREVGESQERSEETAATASEAAPDPHEFQVPAAVAVAITAHELDRLGVPERHRKRTKAALLDLAALLEKRELSWDGLREAMGFAMEFPALGRRLVPLLVPYLDQAA